MFEVFKIVSDWIWGVSDVPVNDAEDVNEAFTSEQLRQIEIHFLGEDTVETQEAVQHLLPGYDARPLTVILQEQLEVQRELDEKNQRTRVRHCS